MALVILIFHILIKLGISGADECVYAAVGTDKLIDLGYGKVLNETLHMRWIHDDQIVYDSKKSAVKHKIMLNGSLLLENLQLENKGIYKAVVYNALGSLVWSTKTDLCVLSPVSKPRLTHSCISTWVTLRCDVGNREGVRVTWSLNGDTVPGSVNTSLHETKAALKPEDRYTCTASNPVSQEQSDELNPKCPESLRLRHDCSDTEVTLRCDVGDHVGVSVAWVLNGKTETGRTETTWKVTIATLKPEDRYACVESNPVSREESDAVYPRCPGRWFQMELWLMGATLAGGGGLLLILLVVLVTVCRRRGQRKRRLEGAEHTRPCDTTVDSTSLL